jgi:uncharacterized protein with HEPN domain
MRKDETYLRHILDAIADMERFMEGVSKASFVKNREKQYAVIRAFEIIGEATKSLSKDLRKNNPQVPWKTIAGMRDKLIHQYFGVNIELVWTVVQENIPQLRKEIKKILKGPGYTGILFDKNKKNN